MTHFSGESPANSVTKRIEDSDDEDDDERVDDGVDDDTDDTDVSDNENDDPYGGDTDEGDRSDDDDSSDCDDYERCDESSPQSRCCYICLNELNAGQDIGSPDSCDTVHYFCLDCIEEWSKQMNTCPVDRKSFNCIVVRREIGSNIIMKLPIVKNSVPDVLESVPEDVTYCEICGRCDREDRLLLCDGCDFGYHCECLTPPLETIPIEEWFCADCFQRLFGELLNSDQSSVTRRRRAIARTGASEAVRQRILARRTQSGRTTNAVKKKRKTKKRKPTKRRKTKAKRTTGVKGRYKKRKTRRKKRRRRTTKSRLASKPLPPSYDARMRIAFKLGIGAPPVSPFGLPTMKNAANESTLRITDLRAAAGISRLSMFGTELDSYDPRVMAAEDEYIECDYSNVNGDGVGVLARNRVSNRRFVSKRSLSVPERPSVSSVDLLSEIMSSQAILHSSSREVSIGRDGSLMLTPTSLLSQSSAVTRKCPNSHPNSPNTQSPPKSPNSPPVSDSKIYSSNTDRCATTVGVSPVFATSSMSSGSQLSDFCHQDMNSIKPIPILQKVSVEDTNDDEDEDEAKMELYSDIESVGDNDNNDNANNSSKEDDSDNELIIDENYCNQSLSDSTSNANSAQFSNQLYAGIDCPTKLFNSNDNSKLDSTQKQNIDSSDKDCNKAINRDNSDKNNNNTRQKQIFIPKQIDFNEKQKLVSSGKNVNTKTSTDNKRRPSIKDLFCDSDDGAEDEASDMRQQSQSANLNVQFPIKMSIVLKNSVINKTSANKSDSGVDDNDSDVLIASPKRPSIGFTNDGANKCANNDETERDNSKVNRGKWKPVECHDYHSEHSKTNQILPSNNDISTVRTMNTLKDNEMETNDDSLPEFEDSSEWVSGVEESNYSICDSNQKRADSRSDSTTGIEIVQKNRSVDEIEKRVDNIFEENSSDLKGDDNINTEILEVRQKQDQEEGEIKDDMSGKVRRCRHGRIRRDKSHKGDARLASSSLHHRNRLRSQSSESKELRNKSESGNNNVISDIEILNESQCKESDDVVVSQVKDPINSDAHITADAKTKKNESKTYSQSSDTLSKDNSDIKDDRIGWKKLSTTTKMRSYRDGKPKDEELLFREREVSKRVLSKTKNSSKLAKNSKTIRPVEGRGERSVGKESEKQEKIADKYSKSSRHKRQAEDELYSDKQRPKKVSEELTIVESRHTERKSSVSSPKKGKYIEEVSEKASRSCRDVTTHRRHLKSTKNDDNLDKEHRRHHHKRKHSKKDELVDDIRGSGRRHHHRRHSSSHHSVSKKSGAIDIDEDSPPMMTGTATKILRDHSSYAEITPLDSKEIYAEGDRIVINVNFKRDQQQQSNAKNSESDEKITQGSDNNTNVEIQRSSSKRDDVYWASPPRAMTTTITRIEDSPSTTSSGTRESLISSGKIINESKTETSATSVELNSPITNKKDNKSIDELRFLPRSLHQQEIRPQALTNSGHKQSLPITTTPALSTITTTTHGPHTPEGDYCEDQFMPTPTQDESQSPIRSRSSPSVSMTGSNSSPALSVTGGKTDEVYDPEAPLQSPVDNQQSKANSTSPQKKSSTASLQRHISPSHQKEQTKASVKKSPVLSSRRPSLSSSTTDLQQNLFSPSTNKDQTSAPKSSPISNSSTSAAIHYSTRRSPFKSPSIVQQRQQLQPSPQKAVVSGTSLMPPPTMPSITRCPTSVSSSIAVTAAAIASINPTNLAQLLQMAQSLKNPAHQQQQQTRQQMHQQVHHQQQQRVAANASSAVAPLSSSSLLSTSQHQHQSQQPHRHHHHHHHQNHAPTNRDLNEVIDMDVESPSPPQITSSTAAASSNRVSSTTSSSATTTVQTLWDQILKSTQVVSKPSTNIASMKRMPSTSTNKVDPKRSRTDHSVSAASSSSASKHHQHHHHRAHQVVNVTDNKKLQVHGVGANANSANKLDQLTVLDDVPSSAVEMAVKEKFIKKLNRQERVIEEVKLVLKPHYQKRQVSKEEYKEILRKSVPKICHSRSGEINPVKIKSLIEGYIKRLKYLRKKSKK